MKDNDKKNDMFFEWSIVDQKSNEKKQDNNIKGVTFEDKAQNKEDNSDNKNDKQSQKQNKI